MPKTISDAEWAEFYRKKELGQFDGDDFKWVNDHWKVVRQLREETMVAEKTEWQRLFGRFAPMTEFDKENFNEKAFPLEPADQIQPVEVVTFGSTLSDVCYGGIYEARDRLAHQDKQLANLRSVGLYMQMYLKPPTDDVFICGPIHDWGHASSSCLQFGYHGGGPLFTFRHVADRIAGDDANLLVTHVKGLAKEAERRECVVLRGFNPPSAPPRREEA